MLKHIKKIFNCAGFDLRPEYVKQTPLRHFLNLIDHKFRGKCRDKRVVSNWRKLSKSQIKEFTDLVASIDQQALSEILQVRPFTKEGK
jgi:hypothetical protein